MTGVPLDYHDFTNVFSKTHTCMPAPHQPYSLKIEPEEGTSPPFSLIYSLSQSELKSLQEFLDEHLAMDFICLSQSLGGAPVPFACKKDGSLWLCIDFCGLNKIMKKDCYPLPCISDLLDSLCKAKIYSKINLQHVYHLVWIHEGDKWKQLSRLTTAPLNGTWCPLDSPTHLQSSIASWMTFLVTCLMFAY